MNHRRQLFVFLLMLLAYGLTVFVSYAFLYDQATSFNTAGPALPTKTLDQPMWYYGLVAALGVMVLYGVAGLLGYWMTRKVGLPGIYSPEGGWRRWVVIPMGLGILCALLLIAGDLIFAPINGIGRFPHPAFPFSILASLSAGIGEEILFRGFVFGLWSLILSLLFKLVKKMTHSARIEGQTLALWIANIIAALGFAAGHFFTAAMLTGAVSFDAAGTPTFLFSQINPMLLVEVVLLNGIIGLVAGWRYMKDGLVAASGVHFWTDIFWHVLWGLIPG